MFANKYRSRQVAESDKRGCFVCHRPTATVLANEVPSADFFYVCAAHLKDKGFAKAIELAEPAKPTPPQLPEKPSDDERAKLDKEIAQLKKDWEKVKKTKGDDKKDDGPAKETASPSPAPKPDFYELNTQIFKLRIDARKRLAQDRKTRQVLATTAFPRVPAHIPANPGSKPSLG